MANNLNSIILEGKVTVVQGDCFLFFCIHEKYNNGTIIKEAIEIPCIVSNHFSLPTINNEVRVVGRLIIRDELTAILVEHLERKPVSIANTLEDQNA